MLRRSIASFGKALVIAETQGGTLVPGTLAAITAAKACGPVTALTFGSDAAKTAEALKAVAGVTAVLTAEAPQFDHGLAEEVAPLVASVVKANGFTHVLAASTALGKGVVPRAAATMDAMPITDVTKVVSEDTFVRFTYAGNAQTTVKTSDPVKFLTIRPTSFDRAATSGGSATVSAASATPPAAQSKWVEDLIATSDKPELTTAGIVVSGGRGLKNGDNFKLLDELAAPLKAAVGATRAVVDAGYVPNDMQIGQTGKVVAPNLYVAVGLSGAIQHLTGMKDSKVIAAINTDPDAPIFSVADYGLVADLFQAVPQMTTLVKK